MTTSIKIPKTVADMNKMWKSLMKMAKEHEQSEATLAQTFNDMLNELFSMDFFGTEGQCDPRGDHRNSHDLGE